MGGAWGTAGTCSGGSPSSAGPAPPRRPARPVLCAAPRALRTGTLKRPPRFDRTHSPRCAARACAAPRAAPRAALRPPDPNATCRPKPGWSARAGRDRCRSGPGAGRAGWRGPWARERRGARKRRSGFGVRESGAAHGSAAARSALLSLSRYAPLLPPFLTCSLLPPPDLSPHLPTPSLPTHPRSACACATSPAIRPRHLAGVRRARARGAARGCRRRSSSRSATPSRPALSLSHSHSHPRARAHQDRVRHSRPTKTGPFAAHQDRAIRGPPRPGHSRPTKTGPFAAPVSPPLLPRGVGSVPLGIRRGPAAQRRTGSRPLPDRPAAAARFRLPRGGPHSAGLSATGEQRIAYRPEDLHGPGPSRIPARGSAAPSHRSSADPCAARRPRPADRKSRDNSKLLWSCN
jgi:hypothetical protein